MRSRKLLSFLLAFFFLFATFPGGMAFAAGTRDATGSHAMAACHESMALDADSAAAHDTGPHARHGSDAPAGAQPQHGCCAGFACIVSLTELSPLPMDGAKEPIAFRPVLRLAARITGIYRPPRQNA
ncbi:MAG: hypothetical protein LBE06_08465 [Azoarcus sp.]|jgi:hypothetical protein|nr:hypothetical protein [Azoarcus sp.]